ncbi:unnamed protein product [Euphydryas editha]|uniref:Reverse transcriptase domain-containing protein n=1 Tax=Euphydryas editha TaxID=104508 RepID=A0AAU9T940_EUPED|nr:unnamed protein product [Euphydryas editha]
MTNLLEALCPDDDTGRDTLYHRPMRVTAALTPTGEDARPPTVEIVGAVIRDLPNTAPGIDGITARIIKHVWAAASDETAEGFRRCVQEGSFPSTWKDGRLVVLPKRNGKPLTDPKAYRPVTLLLIFGKILEPLMIRCAPQMTKGLSDCQHEFTRGRSTVSALRSIFSVARESSSKYVQNIFLDISVAFDNAWWPMILLKSKRGGCPPNIYRMLVDYFIDRRVGMFMGHTVVWKAATMGCPQGSVLGPTLWNVLMDDLLRLPLPGGVSIVAFGDDVTILVESGARAGLEEKSKAALKLVGEWGERNRLEFSPAKSSTMTIRGKLQRPPTIRFRSNSIRSITSTKVLEVVVDSSLSFAQHAVDIGERAANCFGKMSRVSACSWGIKYRDLKILYKGTFVSTVTYVAACWYERASLHVVRSALLRTQRPALILLTKAYRSTSTDGLAVLAGVLPADLEVIRAARLGALRESAATKEELRSAKLSEAESALAAWQKRWDTSIHGRELYLFTGGEGSLQGNLGRA